jgi:MFS family permease
MLFVAVAAAFAFLRIEKRADPPMLDLSIFRNRGFSFANISSLLNFISQYIMGFLTPFFLQRLLHDTPRLVGLTMTAFPLAIMAVAPFSGSLSDRIGTRALACLGTTVSAAGLLLMSRLPYPATTADVVWRLALFGLGTGIFQSPNNSRAMGSAPKSQLGVASGILATTRNVGMVFGIATAGAVLYALVSPATLRASVLSGEEAVRFFFGLRQAYLAGAALAAMAAVTSLLKSEKRGELPDKTPHPVSRRGAQFREAGSDPRSDPAALIAPRISFSSAAFRSASRNSSFARRRDNRARIFKWSRDAPPPAGSASMIAKSTGSPPVPSQSMGEANRRNATLAARTARV